MFKAGRFYKHRNFLDVTMYVIGSYQVGPGYWKLKVMWYCRDLVLGNDKVTVRNPKLGHWREVA